MIDLDNLWDEYAKAYDFFNVPSLAELHQAVGNFVNGKVVDLGAGVGKMLYHLKSIDEYWGVEMNKSMFDIAKNKTFRNVTWINENILEAQLPQEYFDAALMINVLYSLPCRNFVRNVFGRINKILKKDGIFVFTNLNPLAHNMNIEKYIEQECREFVCDEKSEELYNVFLECNKMLIMQREHSGYSPLFFEIGELEKLLGREGFTVDVHKSLEKSFFYGACDLVYCSKS